MGERNSIPDMYPDVDYVVCVPEAHEKWLPFPDVPSTQHFRHTWVLMRRLRPVAPSLSGSPIPRHRLGEGERAAKITMTYFHPWTLRLADVDPHVPHASQLKGNHVFWQDAMAFWLDGDLLSAESLRYVSNFMNVYRVRPTDDDDDEAHSDDLASDEELKVSHASLKDALETRVGGHRRLGDEDEETTPGQACTHQENSKPGMERARVMWAADLDDESGTSFRESKFVAVDKLDEVLQAARSSQRQEKSLAAMLRAQGKETPGVRKLTSATANDVDVWLSELKRRRHPDDANKPFCNAEQLQAIEKVATRVRQELLHEADPDQHSFMEPLRWMVHGGPGTGKTKYVINIIKKELFEGVLKWDMGINFQIVALQAVMAELLGGDTIHHACAIKFFKGEEYHGEDLQTHLAIAKRVLQWRWLIIDEISMVSAKLLAEIDVKLRKVVREIGTAKVNASGIDRPFGGLNVIVCGDFWQLEPPDGGFLGSIPNEYIQNA